MKTPQKHRHTLCPGLLRGLETLAQAGGLAKSRELFSDYALRANFQKLKYWGLIYPEVLDGKKTRRWGLTIRGRDFLAGRIRLHRIAITLNNQLQCYDGAVVDAASLKRQTWAGWPGPDDYAREAEPASPPKQQTFF